MSADSPCTSPIHRQPKQYLDHPTRHISILESSPEHIDSHLKQKGPPIYRRSGTTASPIPTTSSKQFLCRDPYH
ncbi:hypothetical protein BRADI_3g48135v3 [Brachypodium distachyon]|uniref:Uncharacterized protein n=1 Tax=Brachypodium distachyon TaxID=15368 RepID=A0A2K2D3Z0_BRADI|nr:hypothetical protein BRADI_3g48135v3 [Brachypodium distachyon]